MKMTSYFPIPDVLTPRERGVATLASAGLSNKQIARQSSLAEGTVKIHLHHIYRKLDVKNRTSLAALLNGDRLDWTNSSIVRRVGVIGNALDPFHKPFLECVVSAARVLGFEIKIILAQGAADFVSAFAEIVKGGVEAVMVQPSLPRELAVETALKNRLPLFVPNAEFAHAGALMAYSADIGAVYRQSATFVDKIIKRPKAGRPAGRARDQFRLGHQRQDRNALGLTLSPMLLNRADQVIE